MSGPTTSGSAPAARTVRTTARLRIDWTACDGRGLCAELLPEVLDTDPWGYPVARDRSRRRGDGVEVPVRLLPHAEKAVQVCPRLALRLEGTDFTKNPR